MLRIVKVENGAVQGLPAADPRITSFKGIPFAAPPVGENRWRAPQPAKNWDGVLKAYEFGPAAMQEKPGLDPNNIYSREWNIDPEIAQSEDCLQLNVWTSAKTGNEKMPVYVWYYGGGLQVGNPAEMEFDGERIARRGVVCVTINYRVNVFGFLAHPELTKEAPEAPTNFGHLDQQFATKWVKHNIAAFGGDPNNITIGGQSAGAMSVNAQLTSPQNEGLFQKAIMESGFFMSPYGRVALQFQLADAEENGKKFFEMLGVKTLAEARKLDATFIRDKCVESRMMWGTVVDGKFQVARYREQMFKKRWQVPLLYGRTNHEADFGPALKSTEGPMYKPLTSMDDFKEVAKRFGDKEKKFLDLVHINEGLDVANKRAMINEVEVACRSIARAEEQAGLKSPKYYYIFGPTMPGWDNPGAFHSSDLWFWFESLAKCWRPFTGQHHDLARKMCNYWCNFMKTGDPNGADADGTPMPKWDPYTEKAPYGMFLSEDPAKTGMLKEGPSEITDFAIEFMIENGKK